ncbi:SH3 domain-binding protein 5 homolog [Condylostylus longicornis]|uniref:SH3 domain-binding protein 5 homolog n=1 Tax=Condylostylus longicornis TaxID=2530218 RepID=UPI00244DD9FA|nr:SH3 domain-binding protein 5 homolog [Condylostylus longicornis]
MSEIDGSAAASGGGVGCGGDLDPRIQVELENLNTATDEINKLEIELEEANTTFNILMNESTRRLKLLIKKLGNCIEKARPYYDALEKSREAQIECQAAAVKFQRANENHAAAKETVALAEQRFMSNSHEWQFDNAWQEMLNHATQKVMDAEIKKAECHAEHQRKAQIFNAIEMKVQQLEERYRRSIQKSRPYFEEKQICKDQLQTQKNRILELKVQVAAAKQTYSTALRKLEQISEEIHKQRGDIVLSGSPSNYPNGLPVNRPPPPGPREPGVGAELSLDFNLDLDKCGSSDGGSSNGGGDNDDLPSMTDSEYSIQTNSSNHNNSLSGVSITTTTATIITNEQHLYNNNNNNNNNNNSNINSNNIKNDLESTDDNNDNVIDLEEKLRQKVKTLAVRPVEGGDGCQQQQDNWEMELNATVDKLDHLMMMKECAAAAAAASVTNLNTTSINNSSIINTTPNTINNYINHNNVINKKSQETQTPTKLTTSGNNHIINSLTPHLLLQNKFYLSNIYGNKNNKINNFKTEISITANATPQSISIDNLNITNSLPGTPEKISSIKKLKKLEPLPSVNVSMRELPLLAGLSTEVIDKGIGYTKQRRRSLE